jgi:hypothetical protein
MARVAADGMKLQGSQGMDGRDVREIVARLGAQVAVKVSACLGRLGVRAQAGSIAQDSTSRRYPRQTCESSEKSRWRAKRARGEPRCA